MRSAHAHCGHEKKRIFGILNCKALSFNLVHNREQYVTLHTSYIKKYKMK